MSTEANNAPVRKEALEDLIAYFVSQGHPAKYAQTMATSLIFQTDLDLRNAQIVSLLSWLKQEHEDIYPACVAVVEQTREEFENRVQAG